MKRESGRIDGYANLGSARFMQPIDPGRLRIRLAELDIQAVLLRLFDATLLDVLERVASVDLGLSRTPSRFKLGPFRTRIVPAI